MSEEMIQKSCPVPGACPATGYQNVSVCVPVKIKPYANVGAVKTICLGGPVIKQGDTHCPGKPKDVCSFTLSQKLRVEVPVVFGAKTELGEAAIDCDCDGPGPCHDCD